MTRIHIGLPSDFCNDKWWSIPREKDSLDGCDVVKFVFKCEEVEFVCNAAGDIFPGDVYSVVLKEDDCVDFFLLRNKCSLIPERVIEQHWIDRKEDLRFYPGAWERLKPKYRK